MQTMQLSIPEPCQQDWGNMQPNSEGRFCNACAKTVIDFTSMSDAALLAFFATPGAGNICGRANSAQLNKALQVPARPRKKMLLYWQYALTVFLLFARGNTAKAQGEVRLQTNTVNNAATKPGEFSKGKMIVAAKKPDPAILMGDTVHIPVISAVKSALRITNAAGEAIPFASITLLPANKTLVADYDGIISTKALQPGQEIMVTAVGYETVTITAGNIAANTITLPLKPVLLDNVVITSTQTLGRITMGAMTCGISVTQRFQDSIIDFFARVSSALTIYPNPVQRVAGLAVTFNANANELYNVQIISANGQVMMQRSFTATSKKASFPLQVPANWSSGVYFVKLYNAKNKWVGTAKFMVQ